MKIQTVNIITTWD